MKSKERYKQNRKRVFEIMGIDNNDPRYNCHHIIERSDYGTKKQKAFWDASVPSGKFDIDGKSNLFPLKKEVHAELHRRLDAMELYRNLHKKKRKKKRRRR